MRLTRSSTIIVIAVVLATVVAMLPTFDDIGREHVDASFKRALAGFAIARGLNGVISVAQGTELAIQPAGVGVNFTPGEILDPINDLVERFSWIMLLASSSLGIQKVLLSMSAWNGLLLALVVLCLVFVASHYFSKNDRLKAALGRVFLFLLVLRFMMPVVSIANDFVYKAFLQNDYEESSEQLLIARDEIGALNKQIQSETEQPKGLVDRAKDWYSQLADKVDFEKRYENYKEAAETVSENAIDLIVVFVMQTLVFPLIFLLIVFGIMRRLTRWGPLS